MKAVRSGLCKVFAGFSLLILSFTIAHSQVPDIGSIFSRMLDSISHVRTMSYKLCSQERIDNRFVSGTYTIKYTNSPFNAYYKNQDNGIEVLYKNNESKALVNPNRFPYVSLHLDPEGKLMRQNQHQTLKRLGFNYFGNMLHQSLVKGSDSFLKSIRYLNDTVCDGKPCYKMEIVFPDYTFIRYTVKQKGETIATIAAKYSVSDYKIAALNGGWYNDELKVGQTLFIPNRYAKRVVLVIRKEDYLPACIWVYDDRGLFEKYAFLDLKVNVTLPDSEFAANNANYHF